MSAWRGFLAEARRPSGPDESAYQWAVIQCGHAMPGMGGIFLRRRMRPTAEVVNDAGRDVANLFRILQRHYVAFLDTLRFQITTRAEHERLIATDPATLTDLERAARFLDLQRTSYGGKVSGRNFGVAPGTGARFNLSRLEPMREELHVRLAGVVIECLDFEAFIARHDRPETLFYLDPPYAGSEGVCGPGIFAPADFARLADALGKARGCSPSTTRGRSASCSPGRGSTRWKRPAPSPGRGARRRCASS